jgi:hypothetical protein
MAGLYVVPVESSGSMPDHISVHVHTVQAYHEIVCLFLAEAEMQIFIHSPGHALVINRAVFIGIMQVDTVATGRCNVNRMIDIAVVLTSCLVVAEDVYIS